MSGSGGVPWRMPLDTSAQLSNSPRTLVASEPSAFKHVETNSVDMVTSPKMQNAGKCQQLEVELIAAHSKKLQDDLQELGLKIKHHEENLKYLTNLKINLDESIPDMQVALGEYDKASFFQTKKEDPALVKSGEETIQNILKHENSGAAFVYRLKIQAEAMSSDHSLTKDVIGIVATLGKLEDNNLSRLLAEYLGQDTMLAVVCKTYEGVKALEVYNREGEIDKTRGLHGFAASIDKPLADRFIVICLEDIRPYAGEFMTDDPQRRLDLLKPRLPNGETPSGFQGFAVNMINIESNNLHCASKNGDGLRETLFYHLFSNLQVYKSREDMLNALPCIRNGAISLDGGMIRCSGVFSLGGHEKDIDVKFPTGSEKFNPPEEYLEAEKGLKEAKWKRERTSEDMKREQDLLTRARFNYEKKKQELLRFIAKGSSIVSSQYPMGRGSMPG
ncbi:protein DEFECTIVE IN MERISTEM SILENCING 3-like isoform X1 [Salvia hispanica]|uniref:protein DEFECTIVE IN MERISTEM SILENCING 3-like isoform X1 n=1 Tax=Salvia hispanica TaxID=49212 RepID=UPI002009A261|nr:protein DEFECTIVE IN MERISTEM SILENCING 3-like isoform X1 [Salvia hispanica]